MANRLNSVLFVLAMLLAGASANRELQGTTYHAGGECKAKGISGKMGYVRDVWGEAVAKAFVYTCSVTDSTSGEAIIDSMTDIFSDYAKAAVKVYAKAIATCVTSGDNTVGCAHAKAAARKEVAATVSLYAKAVAKAVNKCPQCDPKAFAKLTTSIIVEITAAAEVRVHANVCAFGTDYELEAASQECWASSIAHASAYAFARAVAKGGCLREVAKVKVNAYVDVHVDDPTCECRGWKKVNDQLIWNPPSNFKKCTFHDFLVAK